MQHATETNNPNTRAMYLRLAGGDGALAKQLERADEADPMATIKNLRLAKIDGRPPRHFQF
jgi:hypothetical protein